MADIPLNRGAPLTFEPLRLSVLSANAGAAFSAELLGRTAGSDLRLSDSAGGRFRLSGTTISAETLQFGDVRFSVTEYPGTSGVPSARETALRVTVGHDASIPPRQPNAFTGAPIPETLSADGATGWQRIGPVFRMMMKGDALQALVQIEKSTTDPAVSATPVQFGSARLVSNLHPMDAAKDGFYRDELAWYRVKVTRLVGWVTIRLGNATMSVS